MKRWATRTKPKSGRAPWCSWRLRISCINRMVVGFTTTYAISACHHWCCEFESRLRRSVQHYVIRFVSELRPVGGFLLVLRFPLPIKLTARMALIAYVVVNPTTIRWRPLEKPLLHWQHSAQDTEERQTKNIVESGAKHHKKTRNPSWFSRRLSLTFVLWICSTCRKQFPVLS
jgi:hypothetical protein